MSDEKRKASDRRHSDRRKTVASYTGDERRKDSRRTGKDRRDAR